MKFYKNIFEKVISLENLFLAWNEFKKDKLNKKDVLKFEWNLEPNIIELHRSLKYHKYRHGVYTSFNICDPKQRKIHKATVRDRVLHHAIFRILNPLFEPAFISHSFSCRINKGTHKGVNSLAYSLNKVSKNSRKPCFALKCDIKKFFDSVDHQILFEIIKKRIKDEDALQLVWGIISSFHSRERERGIPIGNLTSQLFANIYLNEFDYFIKHNLRIKHYVRYTDDFVIVADSRDFLENLIPIIQRFLKNFLKLKLHPNKISIRKFRQGIDFLGYNLLPKYRLLRTKTKKRIYKKIKQRMEQYKMGLISEETVEQSFSSYLGVLSHAEAYEFHEDLVNQYWFWLKE